VGISIKLFNYSRTFCLQQHEPLSCLRVESPKRKMGFRIREIGTKNREREILGGFGTRWNSVLEVSVSDSILILSRMVL
jgi:hypothetical protein